MIRRTTAAVFLGAAGLATVLVAAESGAPGRLPYTDPAALEIGKTIYAAECAACHGSDLEGQPDWQTRLESGRMPAPPHDASGHTWHHPDTQLFMLTKYGVEAMVGGTYESDMAGFGDVLSDDEILAVLAYIKSTWPDRVIETHNRINEGN